MADTPEHLAARLRFEGEKTLEFFRSLPPETWELKIYTDGAQWTVRQTLAHLSGAEAGMIELIRAILAGGEGSPPDFDLNAYNERRVERLVAEPLEGLFDRFAQNRRASVALVERLSPADLERSGRHPWLGYTKVAEIIKILYRHNQIHQREIRSAIQEHPSPTGDPQTE